MHNQQVMVINPYITDFKLYDEWMHPLGLYFLISLLKENGAPVSFFNCLERDPKEKTRKFGTGEIPSIEIEKPALYKSIPRKYKLYGRPRQELIQFLEKEPCPAVICIGSMMTYWLGGLFETIKIVRSCYPQTPLVIGGIGAQLMPDYIRKMVPFATIHPGRIDEGHSFRLHQTFAPFPPAHRSSLLGGLATLATAHHGPILSTLGCPMACSYCASKTLQGRFRIRPIDLVMQEITYLACQKKVTDFAFYDDALLYDKEHGLTALLQSISSLNLNLRLHVPNGLHLRYLDTPLLEAMKSAGLLTIRFGYESGAPDFRSDTSTKADRTMLAKKIALVQNAGFSRQSIGVYVMAGLHGQIPLQVLQEIKFIASLGVMAKPVYLSPVPTTALFETYAATFPEIRENPLWHNDLFFTTQLPGWSFEAVEEIRCMVRALNGAH